jgi:hypothetical protein
MVHEAPGFEPFRGRCAHHHELDATADSTLSENRWRRAIPFARLRGRDAEV